MLVCSTPPSVVESDLKRCDVTPTILPQGVLPQRFINDFFHDRSLREACAIAIGSATGTLERVGQWSGEGSEYEKQRYEAKSIHAGRVVFDKPLILSRDIVQASDFGTLRIGGCSSKYQYIIQDITPAQGSKYLVFYPYIALEPGIYKTCSDILEQGTLRQQSHVEMMLTGITEGFSKLSHDISAHHLHVGSLEVEMSFSQSGSPMSRFAGRYHSGRELSSGALEAYSMELNRSMLQTSFSIDDRKDNIEMTLCTLDIIDRITHKMHKGHLSRPGTALHLMSLFLIPMDEVLDLKNTPEIKAEWRKLWKDGLSYSELTSKLRGENISGSEEQTIFTSHHILHKRYRVELASAGVEHNSFAKYQRARY